MCDKYVIYNETDLLPIITQIFHFAAKYYI